tara:strand:+ start:617 stop:901 length:285 start_codon:yes stop_codon:yes gene_type:complete
MFIDQELEKKVLKCSNPTELAKLGFSAPGAERAMAINRCADDKLLKRLATHGDKYVRLNVARHENTDEQTLKELARDREVIIREAARQSLILRR